MDSWHKKPCGTTLTDNDDKKNTEVKLVWSLTLALRATDGGNREYNCRWNETLAIALDDENDDFNCGCLRNDNHEQKLKECTTLLGLSTIVPTATTFALFTTIIHRYGCILISLTTTNMLEYFWYLNILLFISRDQRLQLKQLNFFSSRRYIPQ